MRYISEFFDRVLSHWALNAIGVSLALLAGTLAFARIELGAWISAVGLTAVVLVSAYWAFRDVAIERDTIKTAADRSSELAAILTEARSTAESFRRRSRAQSISLEGYDAYFEPIQAWWIDLLQRVSDLDPRVAARLGAAGDIGYARRPEGAATGNMSLDPMREFLETRIERLSGVLDSLKD